MSTGHLVLQPYMLVRHPAYRAQLEILSEISPSIRVNAVFPEDVIEHERWAPHRSWSARALGYISRRIRRAVLVRRDIGCHYFVGAFSSDGSLLAGGHRVHIDADDPVNLYRQAFRNSIPGGHCRDVALKLLPAMRDGRLTLSFWTETQLRNFSANFHAAESAPLFQRKLLKVLPPCIRPWPIQAEIGRSGALRCLIITAGGKFWHKGVGDAIAAVHLAVEQGYPVTLTVVGEDIPEAWRRFVARHAHYRVFERLARDELDRLFLQNDLLMFPSHHDTYGWVIVEAKARGVPAIATDFYTRVEIIAHEIDGLLIPDPFANPYLPIAPVAYAAGFLEPDGPDRIHVHPLIASYMDSLVAALIRCQSDREFLRSIGNGAYRATDVHGRFGTGTRVAALREIPLLTG